MTDPIAVLQRIAESTAETADLVPDPVGAVRSRVDHRRRGRRSRIGAAAAAVIVLVGGVLAVVAVRDDDQQGVVVSPNPDPTTPSPTDAEVPPSPLNPRHQVAMAAVGDEVVVWGGLDGAGAPISGGAAYDRTTGEWRIMALSPLDDHPMNIGSIPAVAAPVAGGVVIARGTEVARWDQATDTWEVLEEAPAVVTDLVAVGDERLVSISAGAVLDVAAGTWVEPVAGPPFDFGAEATAQVWTGTEVLAIGTSPDAEPGRAQMVAFDPEEVQWRDIPVAPPADLISGVGVAAAWDGERVIVTDREMRAAAYDPATGLWERMPAVPARVADHDPSNASVGGVTVTSTARTLAVLAPDRSGWIPFPSPNPNDGTGRVSSRLVPIDDTTIGIWVDDVGPNEPDLVLLDPTTLAERDRRRQVGVVSVTLGPDDEVTAATHSDDGLVVLSITPAERGPCQVLNGSPRAQGTPEQRAVEETVEVLSGPKVWFHDADGTHWETEVGDQDVVTIECDDPAAARRLVEAVDLAVLR